MKTGALKMAFSLRKLPGSSFFIFFPVLWIKHLQTPRCMDSRLPSQYWLHIYSAGFHTLSRRCYQNHTRTTKDTKIAKQIQAYFVSFVRFVVTRGVSGDS